MKPLTNAKPPVVTSRPGLTRPPTAEERRRAQRVLLRIAVVIHVVGRAPIEGHTHTCSANGALILLAEPLAEGTKVMIENTKTLQTVEAKVLRPPQTNGEGSLVPVEFATPAPVFWNVFFPPFAN
jgi:hypothetical protein